MNIVDIAVKRPVTVWMFTFAIILFGMVSLSRLAINLLPELSYPTLTIRTDYVGAAPGEIEQLVSKPIEETIGVVKGVRTVISTSKAGQSDVLLEFEWGTDMDLASLEVREKLDTLQLPLDIKKPLLLRFNPSLDPVMRFGLGGAKPITTEDPGKTKNNQQVALSDQGIKALRIYAEEQVKRQLESVEGVASVKVGGGLENEIQVLVDQQKTSQLNISVNEVIKRLKDENVNSSGGRVKDGSQEYLVRTLNQFQSLDDIRNLFIANREGRNIRLGDIATVQDSHKEPTSMNRFNGYEGVEIAIYKEGDANTVQVAENIQFRIAQMQENIPSQYQLQLVYDQSRFIANAINEVKTAAIIGGLLAMVVLYLFLKNIWPTLIISISIPVSIIATFNLMYGNNISLNIMSLGGIALAIGLLVDNSIVVLENIARHKATTKDYKQAAVIGTKEVSMAIIASTLTTMAVFFPLVFVEGIAGQLFSDQALTVTFALAASLVVALTLIPMLAAREKSTDAPNNKPNLDLGESPEKTLPTTKMGWFFHYVTLPLYWLVQLLFHFIPFVISSIIILLFRLLSKVLGTLFRPLLWVFDKSFKQIEKAYLAALKQALGIRILVLTAVVTVSLASVLLLPKLGMELIPDMSQGEFFVEITLPTGSQLENTDHVIADLGIFTAELEGVERTYALAGTGSLMNVSASQGGEYWGKLNVVMQTTSSAQATQIVMDKMRTYLSKQAGVQSKFGKPALFTFATPLAVQIIGFDLEDLTKYSQKLQAIMQGDKRFADVKSSLQSGNPELKIKFDHGKLAQLGINAPDVSKLLSAEIGGEVATKYSIEDRKVDILVRTMESQRDSIADIGQMIVNPGASQAIPLAAVADISMSIGPSEITRIGQERVAVVSANLNYGDLNEAVAAVQQHIDSLKLPLNMQAKIAGQNEEMQNSFQSLQFALALAIFLVYLVMASQFESLLHPLLILLTVPLACAGSIYGLYLSGTNISVVVFIGLIMLAGIVVNNAIVLIDRINQLRASGIEKTTAIIEAAQSRLRPILMTTLTTSLGLLPMAIGLGEGAEIRTPMAITVIYGLLFATLLTLFFIPVIYSLFDRKQFENQAYALPTKTDDGETVHG
ncbi:efflux RND transporter permease subunit [Paraglaciecola arctica]|uniref:Hydrophobic/amphiphilic exporter-1, HAE1 family n=1 Tax=Paraglaciecola arctica BSs20135 TaxID=493475 RepID=K6Y6H2_9ALTE|nr:efflux RND transporter permease subunit [Paraglaciecola arctica]GAC19576.1 hydrophobic/amphiphilic exporter-1, HAE1 family [Paraglaciecola arctica BSs20135]